MELSGAARAAASDRAGGARRPAPGSRQAGAPVRCVVGVLLDCVKTTFEQGHWPDARWLG
ncbi:hypothetical protein [Burkholderia seminalis]|uniref:hypothetical protein n=1 Tax=Burkholderia seminalis TaxID=488731 RepID=UPI0026502BB0|nr:hypothetical protein [Burkholderia seminalis]MDN7588037.1 hypothetical protein [Burkholderia seminalis]